MFRRTVFQTLALGGLFSLPGQTIRKQYRVTGFT